MDDLISRKAAIAELDHAAWGKEYDKALAKAMLESLPSIRAQLDETIFMEGWNSGYYSGWQAGQAVLRYASAQPEITDEQAIEHLQSTGWMQNHDKQMYEMGLRERLADDSVSHDALLPTAQPEIIRCKDCKHWDTTWQNDYAPNYHYCPLVDGTRKDDFYCADAEKRGKQDG